jgi:hypothetical protein
VEALASQDVTLVVRFPLHTVLGEPAAVARGKIARAAAHPQITQALAEREIALQEFMRRLVANGLLPERIWCCPASREISEPEAGR